VEFLIFLSLQVGRISGKISAVKYLEIRYRLYHPQVFVLNIQSHYPV